MNEPAARIVSIVRTYERKQKNNKRKIGFRSKVTFSKRLCCYCCLLKTAIYIHIYAYIAKINCLLFLYILQKINKFFESLNYLSFARNANLEDINIITSRPRDPVLSWFGMDHSHCSDD